MTLSICNKREGERESGRGERGGGKEGGRERHREREHIVPYNYTMTYMLLYYLPVTPKNGIIILNTWCLHWAPLKKSNYVQILHKMYTIPSS